jgi:thiol-disulfide isomerase/thioredoxin
LTPAREWSKLRSMVRNVILGIIGVLTLAGLALLKDPIGSAESAVEGVYALFSPTPPSPPAPVVAATPLPKQEPLSGIAAKFSDHLLIMGDDGAPHGFDSSKLAGVKYWAFYYSASWCAPCRAFTPDLVSFYRDFKPNHPNFELIFVNLDQSDADMISYMKTDSMPWPAVWYSDTDNPDLDAKKYCGSGIPCLVLVDSDGSVLSDTFQNGQYTDPHHVIDDIQSIVH